MLIPPLCAPTQADIRTLRTRLRSVPALRTLLDALPRDVWLGAGSVVQPLWNRAAGHPWSRGLKDIDLLYYDADALDAESQEARREALLPLIPAGLELDCVNVARVHLWYPQRFGQDIAPYPDLASAVSHWPNTGSAVMVRGRIEDERDVVAPFGLGDALAGRVRPNGRLALRAVYEAKMARWKRLWPALQVMDWPAPAPA